MCANWADPWTWGAAFKSDSRMGEEKLLHRVRISMSNQMYQVDSLSFDEASREFDVCLQDWLNCWEIHMFLLANLLASLSQIHEDFLHIHPTSRTPLKLRLCVSVERDE